MPFYSYPQAHHVWKLSMFLPKAKLWYEDKG